MADSLTVIGSPKFHRKLFPTPTRKLHGLNLLPFTCKSDAPANTHTRPTWMLSKVRQMTWWQNSRSGKITSIVVLPFSCWFYHCLRKEVPLPPSPHLNCGNWEVVARQKSAMALLPPAVSVASCSSSSSPTLSSRRAPTSTTCAKGTWILA